mmetsp:Transcript_36836/g.55631  ORF Transcript_36836/g.55631 Transcript_36836/m.55631 type:complete len:109 (-) Transcript_36836:13-339(-)
MAPTTRAVGYDHEDHLASVALVKTAVDIADELLRPGGSLLAKVFRGSEEERLFDLFKDRFQRVERLVPPASRAASREYFLLGLGYEEAPERTSLIASNDRIERSCVGG